jgi:exfoliative toxin A/B
MNLAQKMPTAVCGIALAFATLGNLLGAYSQQLKMLCGALSALLLILYLARAALNFKSILEELKNPIAFGTLPTFTMALMLLSTYIKPFAEAPARVVWFAAIALHAIVLALFIFVFVFKFSVKNVFPAWFVQAVGYAVISVTAPAYALKALGQGVFFAGFVLYLVTALFVFYRVKKLPLPPPAMPTLAIFAAPPCLCLAGYFASFDQKSAELIFVMLALCVVSYVFALVIFIRHLRGAFYPTLAAFTFPFAISAVAFKQTSGFFAAGNIPFPPFVPELTLGIACAAVLYVFARYCGFWFAKGAKS